jgi:hypothetical protein
MVCLKPLATAAPISRPACAATALPSAKFCFIGARSAETSTEIAPRRALRRAIVVVSQVAVFVDVAAPVHHAELCDATEAGVELV